MMRTPGHHWSQHLRGLGAAVLTVTLCLPTAPTAAGNDGVRDMGAVQREASATAVTEALQVVQLWLAHERDRFESAAFDRLLSSPGFGAVGRDRLRFELARRARDVPSPSPALRAYVQALSMHTDEVRVRHPEGALAVPWFDVAGTATGTLAWWQRQQIRQRIVADLAASRMPDLSALGVSRPNEADTDWLGTLDALGEIPLEHLLKLRAALANGFDDARRPDTGTGTGYEAALAVAAERLADAELIRQLFATADGPHTLRLLSRVHTVLAPEQALPALQAAIANPALRSAALYALGELVGTLPGVRDTLIGSLADPQAGGTAAAVIARRHDRLLLNAVAALLADPHATPTTRSRAVLALRLEASAGARAMLRDALARGEITPAHLADEVTAWLGR